MPLRVRVTTTTGGHSALSRLATYCSVARLFDAKLDVVKADPADLVVELAFPRKDAGEKFIALFTEDQDFPLSDGDQQILKVESL